MKVNLHNINELSAVINQVHDSFFWLDKVRFCPQSREFEMALSSKRKGPYETKMLITDVKEFTYVDPEEIGRYSINIMRVGDSADHLKIECDPNLVLDLSVGKGFSISITL